MEIKTPYKYRKSIQCRNWYIEGYTTALEGREPVNVDDLSTRQGSAVAAAYAEGVAQARAQMGYSHQTFRQMEFAHADNGYTDTDMIRIMKQPVHDAANGHVYVRALLNESQSVQDAIEGLYLMAEYLKRKYSPERRSELISELHDFSLGEVEMVGWRIEGTSIRPVFEHYGEADHD